MSTYAELYSDFKDEVILYYEHAVVTDRMFMRLITKAAQEFQKITHIVETEKQLFRADNFYVGDDVLEIIELTDENNNRLFSMDYSQFRSELEKLGQDIFTIYPNELPTPPGNRAETIDKYDLSRHPPATGDSRYGRHTRIFTIVTEGVLVYPDRGDEILELRYYPDIHAYSSRSSQWTAWFDNNGADFEQLFNERGFGAQLSPYEDAFLQRAVSRFVGARLDKYQAKAKQDEYDRAIQIATTNKRQLYKFGMSQYSISPY